MRLREAGALRNDRNVVEAAVSQNGLAIQFASADLLRKNDDVRCLAVQNDPNALQFITNGQSYELALPAVTTDGLSLRYLTAELRAEKEICLLAVAQNGLALEHCAFALQGDPEVALAAVQHDGLALEYCNDALRSEPTIVREAVVENFRAFAYASVSMANCADVIAAARGAAAAADDTRSGSCAECAIEVEKMIDGKRGLVRTRNSIQA